MRKKILSVCLAASLIFHGILPVGAAQKQLAIFTKEAIPCYSDGYGSSSLGHIPRYKGLLVKDETKNYYLIEYTHKGKTRTVWISKADARDEGLKYDGSEIATVAEGEYSFGGQQILVDFLGEKSYRIRLKETNQYFSASKIGAMSAFTLREEKTKDGQIWHFKRVNHNLLLQNADTKQYLLVSGNSLRMGSLQEAKKQNLQLIRKERNADPWYNFCQFDGRWGGKKYGSSTTMAEASCGVLVIVNAVYALTGQFIDPMDGAQLACDTGYRIPYNGTDEGFLTAAPKLIGQKYGFRYAGKTNTIAALKKNIQKGNVVLAHVPGHYVAIVDYKEKEGEYLVLDSHPMPKRKTSSFGTWVEWRRLEEGSLNAYSTFVYEKITDPEFQWDTKEQQWGNLETMLFGWGSVRDLDRKIERKCYEKME